MFEDPVRISEAAAEYYRLLILCSALNFYDIGCSVSEAVRDVRSLNGRRGS